MYLRNGLIRFLNVKNNILLFANVFFVVVGLCQVLLYYINTLMLSSRDIHIPPKLFYDIVNLFPVAYLKLKTFFHALFF